MWKRLRRGRQIQNRAVATGYSNAVIHRSRLNSFDAGLISTRSLPLPVLYLSTHDKLSLFGPSIS